MIIYPPGYIGMQAVADRVREITGAATDALPADMYVMGSAALSQHSHINLCVGDNGYTLATFLEAMLEKSVVSTDPVQSVPYKFWINLSRNLRENFPNLCAKAVIMAYLACNDFIQWSPNE